MKEFKRLVIPGYYGSIDIDEIFNVKIQDKSLIIFWMSSGMFNSQYILKGDCIPEDLRRDIELEEEYSSYVSLSESDFEKYKKVLQKLFKTTVIDPLKEERG